MDFKRSQAYFFLGLVVLFLALSFLIFRPYLGILLFAGALAILVSPIHRVLTRFFRNSRGLGAFATVVLTLIVVVLPLAYLIVALASEVIGMYSNLRASVSFDDVQVTLSRLLGTDLASRVATQMSNVMTNLADYVQPAFSSFASSMIALFSNTAELLFGLVILLISLYYTLKDGPSIKERLHRLSLLSDDSDNTIYARVRDAIRAVAFGSFSIAIVKGLIGGALFISLGLQAPVFWGSMIALSSFVPGVGTAIVTAPFAVYLFVTGQFWKGLVFSLVAALVIHLVDNLLMPQIVKSRLHIHPLLILLSILGGLSLMGPIGFFFGPVIVSVTLVLIDVYHKEFSDHLEKSS
jgi:predicted PurR-regulated permease PerM